METKTEPTNTQRLPTAANYPDLLGASIMLFRLGVLILVCILALHDKNLWAGGMLLAGVTLTMYKS